MRERNNNLCNFIFYYLGIINNEEIPLVLSFESEGCVQSPCPLPQGTTANANITFIIREYKLLQKWKFTLKKIICGFRTK